MTHKCSLKNCDGTSLGHALARDFPVQTQLIIDRMERLAHPDDHVKPENLQVDPPEE